MSWFDTLMANSGVDQNNDYNSAPAQPPSMWDMIKAGDYSGAIDSIPVVNTIMGTSTALIN